jgi:hypothetical protein
VIELDHSDISFRKTAPVQLRRELCLTSPQHAAMIKAYMIRLPMHLYLLESHMKT